jgi:hypothetical protein
MHQAIAQVCSTRVAGSRLLCRLRPFPRDYPLRTVISPFFEQWLIEDIGLTSSDLVASLANRGRGSGSTMSASVGVRNQQL